MVYCFWSRLLVYFFEEIELNEINVSLKQMDQLSQFAIIRFAMGSFSYVNIICKMIIEGILINNKITYALCLDSKLNPNILVVIFI